MENSAQRHKRYLYQESEIVAFQRAFNNREKTISRFNIGPSSGSKTLDKIMERSEKKYGGSLNGKTANNSIVFDGSPSCYEGIVRGIFATISKLEAALAKRDEIIALLRQELHDCQEGRHSPYEETVMQELLAKIK